MGARRSFHGLQLWGRAKTLAVEVYRMTQGKAFERDWALRDQLRRCAIRVPSNIAEGAERAGARDSAQFFVVAKGSLAELQTQLEIAVAVSLLTEPQGEPVLTESAELMRMLGTLSSDLRRANA